MAQDQSFDEAMDAARAKCEAQAKRDRRERIATAVLVEFARLGHDRAEAVPRAVKWADALIAALDAEGGDGE